MKKLIYSPPEITVVDFKLERGFGGSDQSPYQDDTFLNKLGLSFSRQTYYSTGEDYSEYTDNSGAFDIGGWASTD